MGAVRRRASDRAGRPPLRSPCRPSVARREERQRFWRAIARGVSSEEAAAAAGVSATVGVRWFRERGGMPSVTLLPTSGPLLVVQRAGRDRAPSGARDAGARGRAAASAFAVDDLARAAAERSDPRRPARVPRHDGAVARGSARASSEAGQARHERGVAAVRAGAARGDGHDAGRRERHWSRRALDRAPPRSPQGSALGELVEPGADRAPAPARLPR
jgi:hypothetical protein